MAPIEPVGWLSKSGSPGGAVVGGAPDAAVIETDVGHVGLAGHAGDSARASGAGAVRWSASAFRSRASGRAIGPVRAQRVPGRGTSNDESILAVQTIFSPPELPSKRTRLEATVRTWNSRVYTIQAGEGRDWMSPAVGIHCLPC